MKKRLMLDMDGVVVDFVGGVARLVGLDPEQVMKNWPVGTYAMEEVFGIPKAEIWDAVHSKGAAFWANLPPYPWTEELISFARSLEDVEVAFLTSPHRSITKAGGEENMAHCVSGKQQWVNRHAYGIPTLFVREKYLCASPWTVLVDDTIDQVQPFADNSGFAILFCQPWNVGGQSTLEQVTGDIVLALSDIDAMMRGE